MNYENQQLVKDFEVKAIQLLIWYCLSCLNLAEIKIVRCKCQFLSTDQVHGDSLKNVVPLQVGNENRCSFEKGLKKLEKLCVGPEAITTNAQLKIDFVVPEPQFYLTYKQFVLGVRPTGTMR